MDDKSGANGMIDADEDVDVFDLSEGDSIPEIVSRWSELPSSSALSIAGADELLCWRDATVVAIVGERNGGKTTLVTELYSCFLRGAFADVLFCHSLSLMGFEKKCFQSRAISGGMCPETPRTSAQEGLSFFHLAVAGESDLKRRDLLISERAGEVYREIRDHPEDAASMEELGKALSVVFIIDGERIASHRQRPEACASVRHLIRAMLSYGNLMPQAQIQLVTTKFDLLEGEAGADAREALAAFECAIETLVAGKHEVRSFHTAARNPHPGVAPAWGLAPLIRSWLRPVPLLSFANIPLPALTDEFDRLMLKRGHH